MANNNLYTAKKPGDVGKKYLLPTWILKVVMAVTGTVFVSFILVHWFGNIKIFFESPAEYNEYAAWLKRLLNPFVPGETFLWALRAVLFGCLILHVTSGIIIYIRARVNRGKFARKLIVKRIPARTMIWTGIIILLFLVFHILDLTLGKAPAATTHFKSGDAYSNLVYSFQRPAVAAIYIIVMGILAFHISHGVWSVVNDFGGTGKRLRAIIFIIAGLIGFVAAVGNACIPIAVQLGVLHL
jgi:succinate dehydrogenase / fumarate reductase cytochrome b subunit